jgi:hypothetical protein
MFKWLSNLFSKPKVVEKPVELSQAERNLFQELNEVYEKEFVKQETEINNQKVRKEILASVSEEQKMNVLLSILKELPRQLDNAFKNQTNYFGFSMPPFEFKGIKFSDKEYSLVFSSFVKNYFKKNLNIDCRIGDSGLVFFEDKRQFKDFYQKMKDLLKNKEEDYPDPQTNSEHIYR